MPEVGIRALKQNASAVVSSVASGQTVIITDRGRAVAQLSPLPSGRLASLLAAGRARPARRGLADLPEATAAKDGRSLTDDLREARDGERD